VLGKITLTRSNGSVKVSTCEQYICETYGDPGIGLLRNVIRALENKNGKHGK
jgi:hypothetical protein